MSRVVSADTPGAKKAVLDYEVVQLQENKALLRVTLHTGRHHQIRVQLSNAGFPIAGDMKYNTKLCDGTAVGMRNGDVLALCSYKLNFSHPVTKKRMCYEIVPDGSGFAGFNIII